MFVNNIPPTAASGPNGSCQSGWSLTKESCKTFHVLPVYTSGRTRCVLSGRGAFYHREKVPKCERAPEPRRRRQTDCVHRSNLELSQEQLKFKLLKAFTSPKYHIGNIAKYFSHAIAGARRWRQRQKTLHYCIGGQWGDLTMRSRPMLKNFWGEICVYQSIEHGR